MSNGVVWLLRMKWLLGGKGGATRYSFILTVKLVKPDVIGHFNQPTYRILF